MRTDVKLGLVASVVVIALGSWYFFDQPHLGESIPIEGGSADVGTSASQTLPPVIESDDEPAEVPTSFALTGKDKTEDDTDTLANTVVSSTDDDSADVDDPNLGELFTLGTPTGEQSSSVDAGIEVGGDDNLQTFQTDAVDASTDGETKQPQLRTSTSTTYVTHTVQSGDTLTAIARMYFGDEAFAAVIRDVNSDVKNWDVLRVGLKLRIPEDAERPTNSTPPVKKPAKPKIPVTYTVESGDSLIAIARTVYGESSKWRFIYDRNKVEIGDDPSALKVDMVLAIPSLEEIARMSEKANRRP